MSPKQLDEEAIFELARKMDAGRTRSEYLEQVCGDNTALLERVKALLEVHYQQAEFLESPPSAMDATIDQPLTEQPGTVIDKYKLMEQIGEGGMEVVYVAEQERPMRRRVALKVIKPGMDSKEVVSRFAAERQALALMDHPNIAKVHDAGTTESGRPYFVMELVRGLPITEYCDLNKFNARQRLDLFIHVCQAVQHAHQKGIIHRDLKPSNVLITEHDGTPVVKVIDFGVAKAINQQLTERTIYTRHQQMVGTPMYMSPEQAELSGLDVDTRSDIYSLGVLLYELLTGTTPFDKQRLSEAAYDEIRRIIREEEPSKPSTKVRTLVKTAGTISGYRGTDTNKLSQLLRGDLDWIVMKSLEKDRNRRYDTAKGLANDIERHLGDEPVVARPPSAAYQCQKFARRHKTMLTSAALVALALVTGTGVATWMAVIANEAKRSAQEAETKQRDLAEEAQLLAVNERSARAEAQRFARSETVARKQAQRLAEQEAAAREETRRQLYRAEMNVALQQWDEGNVDHVIALLQRNRPGEGQKDLRGYEWYHLWQLCRRALETPILEHGHPVHAVAYSPTQNTLVSSGNKWVTLWDLETLQKDHVFESAQRWTYDVAFSPDGTRLAAANEDDNVKVWDVKSKSKLYTLQHDESVWSVEFSPDGRILASGSGLGGVTLWDATTGQKLGRLMHPIGGFWRGTSLAFSSDATLLAVGTRGQANPATLLNVHSREVLGTLSDLDIHAIDFASDDTSIAIKSIGSNVVIWDWKNGQQRSIDGARSSGGTIAFSPRNHIFAVSGPAHTIEIWDMKTGEKLDSIAGHSKGIESAAFSSTGTQLASGSFDGTVRLWDLAKATPPSEISAHASLVESLEFSRDGDLLVSAGNSGVKLWDTRTWRLQKNVDEQSHRYGTTFSPDGNLLAYRSGRSQSRREVHLLDMRTQQVRKLTSDVDPFTHSMAFSPSSRYLAVAGDENIRIWDISGDEEPKTLRGHDAVVECVVFSPDGKTLASGSYDFKVKLWDVASSRLLHNLDGHAQAVEDLVFSPDGMSLISGSADTTLRRWDVAAGQELGVLSENLGSISGLAPSWDQSTLAIAADRSVVLWDLREQRERVRFRCQSDVEAVAFSPDGRTLVAGLFDGTIRIWQAADPEEVRRAGW